ncbi:MAG: symmetrical bis(5'-nucleosyl)-tetraphosphatase [Deltaproteobacteria bacterium]|nr:symmetrical bis(5'-nucleosyl)-tetraphosphatase [Deltaproteobacteria bacterium]
MATYAVGDIQGCMKAVERLLKKVCFDPRRDRIWLAGDLVNRGPDSLGVLRWARSLGDRAVVVLGNHDLHLLAVAHAGAPAKRRDTLAPILEAPDRDELLGWLRRQKLLHREDRYAMVHAGLLPGWSVAQALELARELEDALAGPHAGGVFERMYGDEPRSWRDGLRGPDRRRVVINALTRMRMLTRRGEMDLGYSGSLADAPPGLIPWFDFPGRKSRRTTLICGHWAALGLVMRQDLLALDSGCAWGRQLTAVRLEDHAVFQVRCPGLG